VPDDPRGSRPLSHGSFARAAASDRISAPDP
jgi:hypothetical protein